MNSLGLNPNIHHSDPFLEVFCLLPRLRLGPAVPSPGHFLAAFRCSWQLASRWRSVTQPALLWFLIYFRKNLSFSRFKIIFKIYLLAVRNLCRCAGFSLVSGSRGYFLVVVRVFLIAMASLAAEHGL